MADVIAEWWQDDETGCTRYTQRLPDGEAVADAVLGGTCELSGAASGPGGATLLLRGALSIEWLRPGEDPLSLSPPDGAWPRQVAFGADGVPLLLTADDTGEVTDEGGVFRVATWRLEGEGWTLLEEASSPVVRTVRAVEGGPAWAARAPGSTADSWVVERSPGFVLELGDGPRLPRKVRQPGGVACGHVPLGDDAELVVRYAMLGVPLPVGPVLVRRGRKWEVLDDRRLLEAPVAVERAGSWLALSYEGWSPLLVDLSTGRPWWPEEERGNRMALRLVTAPATAP